MGSQGNISGVSASKLVASSSGPNIVKDGLTVLLDSRSKRSYPGSGNTWYDLSGNNNHASLVNFTGPGANTFSGYDSNTRFMMYDRHVGTSNTANNNYALIPNSTTLQDCVITSTGGFSTMFWFRQDQYFCTALTKWNGSWEVFYCDDLVFRTQGTGGSDYNTGIDDSVNAFFFQFIACTHDGTTRKVYLNRLDQDIYRLNTPLENSNTISSQNTTTDVSVGAYYNGNYACKGALPYYMLYNRALSEDEIRQNFNATKRGFIEIKFC